MEHYLATMNEIVSFAGKWMELEINMLNYISQTQKDTYDIFLLICRIKKGRRHEGTWETTRPEEANKGKWMGC